MNGTERPEIWVKNFGLREMALKTIFIRRYGELPQYRTLKMGEASLSFGRLLPSFFRETRCFKKARIVV